MKSDKTIIAYRAPYRKEKIIKSLRHVFKQEELAINLSLYIIFQCYDENLRGFDTNNEGKADLLVFFCFYNFHFHSFEVSLHRKYAKIKIK